MWEDCGVWHPPELRTSHLSLMFCSWSRTACWSVSLLSISDRPSLFTTSWSRVFDRMSACRPCEHNHTPTAHTAGWLLYLRTSVLHGWDQHFSDLVNSSFHHLTHEHSEYERLLMSLLSATPRDNPILTPSYWFPYPHPQWFPYPHPILQMFLSLSLHNDFPILTPLLIMSLSSHLIMSLSSHLSQ